MRLIRRGWLRSCRTTLLCMFTFGCAYVLWRSSRPETTKQLLVVPNLLERRETPKPPVVKDVQGLAVDLELYSDVAANLSNPDQIVQKAVDTGLVGFRELGDVNCNTTFSGDHVRNDAYPLKVGRYFSQDVVERAGDCVHFRTYYGFRRYPKVTKGEEEFPLAFSILLYKDIDQVLYLLRAIYRPHNVYCLHVDSKSSVDLFLAVQAVVKCLPNVHMASRLEHIIYAGFSRLQADLTCMKDLLTGDLTWKYFLNLPAQQFPLKTNLEMVKILKVFGGSNDVEGLLGKRILTSRFTLKYEDRREEKTGGLKMVRTSEVQPPPPHGLTVVKGSAYGTFSRAFVNFVLTDPVAQDLITWSKTIYSPDEYVWSTLHHSHVVKAPGGYTGAPDKKPWLSTYALWGGQKPECSTQYVHGVCIFSTEDLPHLLTRRELFANKFYITHHPAALHCLDRRIYQRTLTGTVNDLSYYKSLPFVHGAKNDSIS